MGEESGLRRKIHWAAFSLNREHWECHRERVGGRGILVGDSRLIKRWNQRLSGKMLRSLKMPFEKDREVRLNAPLLRVFLVA